MRENVEGFEGPLVVLQFKGGQSNPTYRLNTPNRSYVMRRKPFGKLLPSAHAVDREYRVIAALGKPGLSGRARLCAVPGRWRDRRRLLHHVDGGGPGVLGSDAAESGAGSAAQDLHQQDRDAGEAPHVRSQRHRPRRLRQARQLLCAPDRPLDQAVSGLRDPAHSGVREGRRMAAADGAGAGARLDRPW
ncbi:phosphotransferase [Bradyrhizobium sp. USDA 326]|uniref:phosphotransferase n=1 Tax=Bradyrhizobium sp. USDA 326 TaxID=3377726 RepID=UPI003C73DE0F